jgi:D-alanyl-D-alanine carboxypeptidase/D-alanyl-D-alanine-endopeptidase (penicillin-binding protein 4)
MMLTRSRLIASLLLSSAILAFVFAAQRQPAASDSEKNPSQAKPNSLVSSDRALLTAINETLEQSDSSQARWGVFVMSLNDGRVLCSRDGERLFTPASNMKIFTTAVALDLLGEGYRWRTSMYAEKPIDANGVLDGDLVLYGRGAPDLDSKRDLPALANQLYERGLRQVRGDLVGDKSYFRGESQGLGWQWNDLQWYYGAEPSALSVDENTVEVTLGPGNKISAPASVLITPNDNYFQVTNAATTADSDAPTTVGIVRDLSGNGLRVWGEFPSGGRSFSAFISVFDPALRAAKLLKQALIARGIKVEGQARSRDARSVKTDQFDPQKASELAYVESATLAEIVHQTNKESNNLFAELISRTLGKERGTLAPDPDERKNRARGDDEAGPAVVKWWLSTHGIPANVFAIHDGSGLSRLDLISPESAARLLAVAAQSPWAKSFHDSLPNAGRDGTLGGRLQSLRDRVSAKTGSLTYDHSLSGYLTTADNRVLVFSIICNDATGHSHPVKVIDSIVELLSRPGTGKP